MDSWLSRHELEPRTTEDPPSRGYPCTLNMPRLKRPSIGVVWKFGEGVTAHGSSSLLHNDKKFRGPLPKALENLYSTKLIFPHYFLSKS
ncbi:hypothetical protein TNCV_1505931 [Trichonephila clavipes]|nr:hypothetical protein TNCV_1505931 [Trichonephila clavipes]